MIKQIKVDQLGQFLLNCQLKWVNFPLISDRCCHCVMRDYNKPLEMHETKLQAYSKIFGSHNYILNLRVLSSTNAQLYAGASRSSAGQLRTVHSQRTFTVI